MYIVVNDMVDEPLYMQIRSQIIAGHRTRRPNGGRCIAERAPLGERFGY